MQDVSEEHRSNWKPKYEIAEYALAYIDIFLPAIA